MALFLLESFLFVTCITQSFMRLPRESRIVNGVASSISQYPFAAAIRDLRYDRKGRASISDAWCGGSLIRKTYPAAILTASHCVFGDANDIIVELNASHTQQAPTLGISSWSVINIVTHEEFDSVSLDNDIAILFIDVDLTHRHDLSTVTIPTSIECCGDGETLEVIGYGRTSLGGSYSTTLEHTNLQLMDRTACNQKLCQFETRSADCSTVYAKENHICGIGDQTTPCHGDSGSPLLKKGTTEQIGVVSWGIDCVSTIPTIFTNTAVYYSWINDKLNQFIGRNSVAAAAVPPLQPMATATITDEEAIPVIIHHMFDTSDAAQETTAEPTVFPSDTASVEPTPHPFYNPSVETHSTTAANLPQSTDSLQINESNLEVVRRIRSIIVTASGFIVILCMMTIVAICCKQKDKEDDEHGINVVEEQMRANPYIIAIV